MEDNIRYCACGCGGIITSKNPNTKLLRGHATPEMKAAAKLKTLERYKDKPRAADSFPLCACGCGERVKTKGALFIGDHYLRVPGYMDEIKRRRNDPAVKEKIKKTCLEKYGVDNPSKTKEVVQKISNTIQERYGVEWATQKSDYKDKVHKTSMEKYGIEHYTKLDSVKEKSKQTNIEKYGTEFYQQSDESKEHYKQLSLEKYGTEYAFQSEEVKNKIKSTLQERYGVDNIMELQETTEKIKQSNLEKYGVEWSRQSKEIINKGKKTCLEKYGVDNPSKNKEIILKILSKIRNSAWNRIIENEYWKPLFQKEYFLEHGWLEYPSHISNIYEFECKKCGTVKKFGCHFPKCPKCNPPKFRSAPEIELFDYIKSLLPETDIEHSNRTILDNHKELDIYIPSKNIAFEFNGLYWHSISCQPDINYHVDKTNQCLNKGIHLIHVMEDEWYNNKEVTKARIRNLLGFYDKTIYARQCECKLIINKSDYIDFLKNNHSQGFVGCKYPVGLYYQNELVSLMTFGSLRKSLGSISVENNYELLRFCNRCGYHIPGSASKLFKYFIKNYNPVRIISYADRRWSDGNLYYKLGFKLNHISKPNYWYIDPTYENREYRFKYRKSELHKLLESFNVNLSEQQNMLNNGFNIIYDCGNYVFEWKK